MFKHRNFVQKSNFWSKQKHFRHKSIFFKLLVRPGFEPIMDAHCNCNRNAECVWHQKKSGIKKVIMLPNAEIGPDGLIHPQCIKGSVESDILCPDLPEISNGFVHCNNGNIPQSRCKIQCNHGFVLNGNSGHVS